MNEVSVMRYLSCNIGIDTPFYCSGATVFVYWWLLLAGSRMNPKSLDNISVSSNQNQFALFLIQGPGSIPVLDPLFSTSEE